MGFTRPGASGLGEARVGGWFGTAKVIAMKASVSPRDQSVGVGDLAIRVRIWSDKGPPVVLLHGLASSARTWDLVAPLLARRLQVVAVDLRGHGESDKP